LRLTWTGLPAEAANEHFAAMKRKKKTQMHKTNETLAIYVYVCRAY